MRSRFGEYKRVLTPMRPTTRTKQQFKEECDINNIIKKFGKTGILPQMIQGNPSYGDFSDLPTYQEALNIVQKAQEQFAGLSSRVRERFGNDPSLFLKFATDPRNQKEMVDLGLATKRPSKANVEDMGGGSATPPTPKKAPAPKAGAKKESSEE